MCSCAFCYVAGLYGVLLKFGAIKLISRYGISGLFDEIPQSFPEIKYMYGALALYTLAFALIAYVIYRVITRHGQDTDALQAQIRRVTEITDRAQKVRQLFTRYEKQHGLHLPEIDQQIRRFEQSVASMPAGIVGAGNAYGRVGTAVERVLDAVSALPADEDMRAQSLKELQTTLDECCDELNMIKRKNVQR